MSTPQRTSQGWRCSVLRTLTKTTIRLRLHAAPLTRVPAQGPEVTPRLADVSMTTVDGATWQVHGVTISGDASSGAAAGRYFRRQIKDGTWAHDTPAWVRSIAEAAATGGLVTPSHLCSVCGYAVEPGDEGWDGQWRHADGADVEHLARPVMV